MADAGLLLLLGLVMMVVVKCDAMHIAGKFALLLNNRAALLCDGNDAEKSGTRSLRLLLVQIVNFWESGPTRFGAP